MYCNHDIFENISNDDENVYQRQTVLDTYDEMGQYIVVYKIEQKKGEAMYYNHDILEKIQNDDENVYRTVNNYFRQMVIDTYERMKDSFSHTFKINLEKKRQFQKLKAYRKQMLKQPNAFVSMNSLTSFFKDCPIVMFYFDCYEKMMENMYESSAKSNLLANLCDVERGKENISYMQGKAHKVLSLLDQTLYETPFGFLSLGRVERLLPLEKREEFICDVDGSSFRNSHLLCQKYAPILDAVIVTGYIDSPFPNLRIMHSWLEKDDYSFDFNTGIFMPTKEYISMYNAEVVNEIHYRDLYGKQNCVLKEDDEEIEIAYVCYKAYEKVYAKQKKKQL